MKKPAKKSLQTPYDPSLKEKARQLRNNPTPAEKNFWNALRAMPFYKDNTFNRQKPFGKYIVDFYRHEQQLVIEIDGDTHYEDQAQIHDRKRTEFLESQGLRVIRITNREVMESIDGVLEILEKLILKKAEKSPPALFTKRGPYPSGPGPASVTLAGKAKNSGKVRVGGPYYKHFRRISPLTSSPW